MEPQEGRVLAEIAEDYYKTTAARGHTANLGRYKKAAMALQRRLQGWLPPPDARCLDLACGCGEMLFALENVGCTHTAGVDLCFDELKEAKRFVKGDLVHGEILQFLKNTPDGEFDFVSALNILEHLPKDTIVAVLREVRRVLAPGGVLIAMVPNAISPFGALTRHWDFTHEWAFTPNNFRQLAILTGYQAVSFRECGPIAHGILSVIRYLAWSIIRGIIAIRLLIELADAKGGVYTMDMLVKMDR